MSHQRPVETRPPPKRQKVVAPSRQLETRYQGQALAIAYLLRYRGVATVLIVDICDQADLNHTLPFRFNALVGTLQWRLPGLAVVIESRSTRRIFEPADQSVQCPGHGTHGSLVFKGRSQWDLSSEDQCRDAMIVVYNTGRDRYMDMGRGYNDASVPVLSRFRCEFKFSQPLDLARVVHSFVIGDLRPDLRAASDTTLELIVRYDNGHFYGHPASGIDVQCRQL